MICFQGMYLLILCLLRPADDPVNNLIEIINECIFSALLIILLPINSASEWTNLIESIFIWIMVGNTLTITVILVTSFIFKLKKKCNNLPEKNKIVDISGKVSEQKMGRYTPSEVSSTMIGMRSLNRKEKGPVIIDWKSPDKRIVERRETIGQP